MKIFSLFLLVFSVLFFTACDNSQKETGTSLFDDLTSTSDYTEYLSAQNSINSPLMVFGKITTWKNGIESPVPGARVTIKNKDSAVTDVNGNYYIKDIHLTKNSSGEVSQESATINVDAEGYSSYSSTIMLNKGVNIEVNISLISSYPSDNPGGHLYGIVKDYYTGLLLDSMEVYISGSGTAETGLSGEKGAFSYKNIPLGTHSVTIIDKNGFYQDYYNSINILLGENHVDFELKRTNKDNPKTGNVVGIVKSNGLLLSSIEVMLDNKYTAKSDKNGWFELSDISGSKDIPVGNHIITARYSNCPYVYCASAEIKLYDFATDEVVFPGNNVIILEMSARSSE